MTQQCFEINFDALVGPSHNHGGLAYGNRASMKNKERISNPKKAALQGLEKMKLLFDLGIRQAVLPPHPRPYIPILRQLGFLGNDRDIPAKVAKYSPELLRACSSSSAMWTANWATATPSVDAIDKRVHLTPANLTTHFHRAIEASLSTKILKAIFSDPLYFTVHDPLFPSGAFSDEGAANQSRFCRNYGDPGVIIFCWGKQSFTTPPWDSSHKFPARQSFEACKTLLRTHQIFPQRTIFLEQNPKAIDEGAFHTDVVATVNRNLMLYHEWAFNLTTQNIEKLRQQIISECNCDVSFIQITQKQIPINLAVSTYLFNSQLISLPDDEMVMISPMECRLQPVVFKYLNDLTTNPDVPIREVHYVDLKESMLNGGGPACLRLRVVLNQQEIGMIRPNIFFNEILYKNLKAWIQKYYRDQLELADLADPQLIDETYAALQELTELLKLGAIYHFQT